MCICVCICANNMQILGFGRVGGVRSGGGIPLGGRCGGPGTGLIYTYIYIYIVTSNDTIHYHYTLSLNDTAS